jgi:hypothetical protein
MRRLGSLAALAAVVAAVAAVAAVAPLSAATPSGRSPWAAQADRVCVVWLAKVEQAFGKPVTGAQLYGFAGKAKSMESQELAALDLIPGRTPAGTAALAAVKVDIAEVGSAIAAWNQGNAALFVKILKQYLNDGRAKSAFSVAGATRCG